MGSIAGTVLENALISATEKLMKFEKRRPDLGVIEAFDKYKADLVDEAVIKKNRASARRQTNIAVLNRQATTIRTQRSTTINPNTSTSAKVGLNWGTYGFDIGVTEAINADNQISATADLANQIVQGMRDLLKRLDADFAAVLETGKYSALPSTSLMTINGGAYMTTQSQIFVNAPAVLRNLELEGPYHMLSNVEALATLTDMGTRGKFNDKNLEKLLEGYEFGYSKNLSPGSSREVYYTVPTGSLGLVDWIEYDCRKPGGRGSYDGGVFYDTMTLEFTSLSGYSFSIEFGFLYIANPADKSSVLPGLERAYTEGWSLFVDIAPVKAYSSEAGKSPIVKMLADSI